MDPIRHDNQISYHLNQHDQESYSAVCTISHIITVEPAAIFCYFCYFLRDKHIPVGYFPLIHL